MHVNDTQAFTELKVFSHKIVHNKLVAGPGGNISIRIDDTMWISPSGYSLDDIPDENWVAVDITTGKSRHPTLRPSSEILMHLYVYRERSDVNAIVHTHPPITIGLISSGYDEIPPLFPDYVVLMGKVPFINYIVPCSEELAQAVVQVLRDPVYNALFMKNHGLITLGSTMKQAYYRTELVEDSAKIFWVAKSLGTPRILTEAETNEVLNLEAEKYRQRLLSG
jgi:L-fuculose-phosphate aldolase